MLCATLGTSLDRSTEVGRLILDWPGRPEAGADNVTLRLCGGLHFLVRSGAAPELASCYPPNPAPNPERLREMLDRVLRDRGDSLRLWLDSPPQTNEVGRSAVLMAGLMAVAERYKHPVVLLELGASAGLNLLLDRYGYDLGGVAAGDPASPLRMRPQWKGPPPPVAPVTVAGRSGVDLRPIDARRDGDRLLAYVWPDQPDRLARLETALGIAGSDPPAVDQGDAADWIEAKLAAPPVVGTIRVVLHSIAYQYFPEQVQARIEAAIEQAGAAANEQEPLAWLRFEMLGEDERPSLRLRLWPGGSDRLLAWAHPHGKSIRWLASEG
jgi:hypothetical protein